jgi:hypothetical protein
MPIVQLDHLQVAHSSCNLEAICLFIPRQLLHLMSLDHTLKTRHRVADAYIVDRTAVVAGIACLRP